MKAIVKFDTGANKVGYLDIPEPVCGPHSVKIAHKTGEDDGITHDVGIVYARQPFIVCFCGEHVSPPEFERAMQDITLMLYENAERIR